jgi:hypothetical protein
MGAENPYTEEKAETPLERAAEAEAQSATQRGSDTAAEHEADVVVGDVDDYVAINDPAALAEAEAALNAWEVPTSPFDGVPGDVALHPGQDGEPLVSVFSARNESEANIVKGLLESQGIAAIFREVATPSYGSIFSVSEGRWADILVAQSQAQEARDAIVAAQSSENDITPET